MKNSVRYPGLQDRELRVGRESMGRKVFRTIGDLYCRETACFDAAGEPETAGAKHRCPAAMPRVVAPACDGVSESVFGKKFGSYLADQDPLEEI